MPKSVLEEVAYDEMVEAIYSVWKAKMKDLGFPDWKFEDDTKDNFFEQPVAKTQAAKLAKEQLRGEIVVILSKIKVPK